MKGKNTMLKTKINRLIERIPKKLRKRWVLISALIFALFIVPFGAKGQIGLDPCCAIISAGLTTISQLLKGVVAQPLGVIQQTEQQQFAFEQQVVYPTNSITNAQGLASIFQGQIGEMNQLYRLPVASATLPTPQQFEQVLLSHNPQSLPQVTQNYQSLYGTVMPPNQALDPVRNLVDMSDAEAQAALKKAVELDALADVELQAANAINRQIQDATPGSAPILEAQAATWLVRANAYSQSAMAELVRVRSIGLANTSAQLKFGATDTGTLGTSAGQVLQRGAQ